MHLKTCVVAACLAGAASLGAFSVAFASVDPDNSGSGTEAEGPTLAPPDSGAAADASEEEATADKPYWRTNLFKRVWTDQKFLFNFASVNISAMFRGLAAGSATLMPGPQFTFAGYHDPVLSQHTAISGGCR